MCYIPPCFGKYWKYAPTPPPSVVVYVKRTQHDLPTLSNVIKTYFGASYVVATSNAKVKSKF